MRTEVIDGSTAQRVLTYADLLAHPEENWPKSDHLKGFRAPADRLRCLDPPIGA
jgi:hypothetical protein